MQYLPHFGFAPDPARGAALDARMHRELAASLAHIAESLTGAYPNECAQLREFVARLDSGVRVPALAFGTYFEIARTLLAGDPAPVPQLVNKLTSLPERASALTVCAAGASNAARSWKRSAIQAPARSTWLL